MRLLITPLLVLAAAAAVPAAAQLEGGFALAQINGQPLPSASPTETSVVIDEMSLRLDADAHHTMRFRMRRDGTDAPFQVEAGGTYRVEGDQLVLRPDEGSAGVPATFRWTLAGDVLRLYDEQENEYHLVRQAAAAAGEPWSPGAWNAVRMNDRPLPAPWPLQPQLTVTRLSFEFTEDGLAIARISGTVEGEATEEVNRGHYRIEGDRLVILDDGGAVDEEFGWRRGGGTLVLVDKHGYTYTLAPAAAP